MFDKSRLTAILLVSIFGFLDTANGETHEEVLAFGGRNAGLGLINAKPKVFKPYTDKKVTCADAHDNSAAYNCCLTLEACTEVIPPRSAKYGIQNPTNEHLYGCGCSLLFRDCLQVSNDLNPSSLFEELGRTYFDAQPRKCLYRLYRDSCDGPFYDEDGNPHNENPAGYFFCPKELYTKKYYEMLLAP